MSSKKKKTGKIVQIDGHKPFELMTPEEKDEYFMTNYELTYAEWCEKYKDDTLEKIHEDMRAHIKTL